ncbi:cysteine-rich VLP protein, partial [Clostridioides difficile]|uniref:cysteine-rich VLP protein n=1 Tax=Clostridioides difficile TaxID=1496 RepID=UPI001C63C942
EECVCPQHISYSLLCKWFQTAVLPLDKLLYAELFKTEDKKRCTECGAAFASTSNSVKYCPDCRKRITRRQAAERMRKRRALVTQ